MPGFDHRENIDAVTGAAALHQEYAAGSAKVGTGKHGDAFLFGGESNGVHIRVGQRAIDERPVSGVRNIGELRDVVFTQQIIELVRPLGVGR